MDLFVQQITVKWKPTLQVNYTGSLLPGYPVPGYPRQPYTRAFNEFLTNFYDFFNFGKFVKIREFFLLR